MGERCVVPWLINGNDVNVLHGTGAQVSMISHDLIRRNLIDCEVKSIQDLLGAELGLTAANETQIPYIGYVDVNLRLKSSGHGLVVPMLVSKKDTDLPLIGSNVIQEIKRDPVGRQT